MMRIFELCLYVYLIIIMGIRVYKIKSTGKWLSYMSLVAVLLFIIHAFVEGVRWQMIIAYLTLGILVISSIWQLIHNKPKQVKGVILARTVRVIGMILFIVTLLLPVSFPIFDLPEPQGDYQVGYKELYFVDESRAEVLTASTDDVREFMAGVWYPTDENDNKMKTYFEKGDLKKGVYEDYFMEGNFWYNSMALINTNSQIDVGISSKEDSYPLLVYSHSYGGSNVDNTMLFEELASNGYIVLSISHSYESIGSLLPDGRVIKRSLKYIEDQYGYTEEKDIQGQIDLAKAVINEEHVDIKKSIIRDYLRNDGVSGTLINIRVNDIQFLVDTLEEINSYDSILEGKLDLENIGAIGWSFGGASSLEAAIVDQRIDVSINLDGWPYGSNFINAEPIEIPFMYLVSDLPDNSDAEPQKIIMGMLEDSAMTDYVIKSIKGTQHINYSDFATYYAVTRFIGVAGEIAGDDMKDVYREHVLPFLDAHLK